MTPGTRFGPYEINALMSVDVVSGDTLEVSPPPELFRANPLVHSALAFMYAATPDGPRCSARIEAPDL